MAAVSVKKKRRYGDGNLRRGAEKSGVDVLGPLQDIIRQTREGSLSGADLQALCERRNPFPDRSGGQVKIAICFALNRQFASTEKAIKAGNYAGGHDDYISSRTYPLRDGRQEKGRVLVALDFSGWGHNPSTKEIRGQAGMLGLCEPVYEDGLRLGAEYPGRQYERSFAVMHEADAQGRVLCLSRWDGKRSLSRVFALSSDRWSVGDCLFVFALPLASG